jgi:assimilatory nitrate reductase catalytic subunit
MEAGSEPARAVRTTCPYCGVGCGILAGTEPDGTVRIVGDPDHPANFGRLCSKGSVLAETIGLEDRLLAPMVRGPDGTLAPVSWDVALDRVAQGISDTVARNGRESVAFYLSGQLLTEDYYVANKLMKGFIGSANVDTNSRLCMASSVAGHRRAFGSDTVPCSYEDLDLADLIVLVGSNAAWCHPILYQRILANKRTRGAKIIVVDPRRTATAEDADLFLPIAPGMDSALFCGLLVHLAAYDAVDPAYIEAHTSGYAEALAASRDIAPTIEATARASGLAAANVARFFDLFRRTARVVTCFSQGVNQSAQGADKVNAIVNCHLATGRIGRPGAGPFSLTGQPNAMGGREVGGLANQLAAHMSFTAEDVERVGRFWRAPNMAPREGLKAVQMFEAIAGGKIKALWVMATNPAVSLPRAGAVRDALGRLDLLVVSENVVSNDTVNAGAHILLPAAAWGEKDGTVTNSERRMSRQRAFLRLPGQAKPDWWIVSEVARRMGFGEAFSYRSAAEIFREHAALSAFENAGTRDFDIGALAKLDDREFDALDPVQWPVPADGTSGGARLFADGRFFTPDGRARLIVPQSPSLRAPISAAFPLRLNTGRVRDQWHSMTRSGRSARLAEHRPEPFVEVHPQDAAAAGLRGGGLARVTSPHGSCVLKVVVSDAQRRGSVFVPIHWSDETASSARVGDLIAAETDPHSGQPESKATPVRIAPVEFQFHGFVLARRRVPLPSGTWWSRVTVEHGVGLLIAADRALADWRAHAQFAFGPGVELAEFCDEPRSIYRVAAFADRRLIGCLFLGPADEVLRWEGVKALLGTDEVGDGERRAVLSGKPLDRLPEPGPVICVCFGIGLRVISAAIEDGRARTVEEIGAALQAGTNCGSCLPELRKILADRHVAETA